MAEPIITRLAEAEAVAKLTAQPRVEVIQGVPYILQPDNWTHTERENLLPNPTRKRGRVILHDLESFIDVAKRQGSLTHSNIYLDLDFSRLKIVATAVFNDHDDGDGLAGWRDHRAVFSPRFSEEWTRWTELDKKAMEQNKLAHFLEGNICDIVSPPGSSLPTGADVLQFVSRLEETRKVKYGSAVNLQNGMVQLEFIEEGEAGTRGRLELFREFALGIRVFFGGDAYQIKAFLRYRIDRNSGAIIFWYELQRPDRLLEDAAKAIVETIRAKAGMPVVFGSAD